MQLAKYILLIDIKSTSPFSINQKQVQAIGRQFDRV